MEIMTKITSLRTLLAVLLACFVQLSGRAASGNASAPVTLYGSQIYAESGVKWGLYSFPAQANTELTPVWLDGDLMATGGAVYANGKYYIISFMDLGFLKYGMLLTCDIDKQEYEQVEIEDWNNSYITTDMTFDPSSGNIYACSMNEDGSASFNLSTMDVASGKQTPIAPVIQLCALAASADGTLYGISQSDGTLYTIDKTDASLTKVGSTGVQPSPNQQSATIDPATGILYWAAYTNEGSELYTVDTKTGHATLVSEIPDKAEFVGLFIKDSATSQASPATPTGLNVVFDKASLSGTATFTMPETDVNGQPLSGNLTWQVSCNGTVQSSGEAMAGDQISTPVSVNRNGMYDFAVTASQNGKSSTAVKSQLFVGMDTPVLDAADINVEVTKSPADPDSFTVTVSWPSTAVSGQHGGYVDSEKTAFRIVRQPGDILVNEASRDNTFKEEFHPDEVTAWTYEITPDVEGQTGATRETPYFHVGEFKQVPYLETFPDTADFTLFTVVDANADRASWEYDRSKGRVKYIWAYAASNDDWIVSPPLRFENLNNVYSVKLKMQSEGDIYAGTVSAFISRSPEVGTMTEKIIGETDIDKSTEMTLKSDALPVKEAGIYYVGLHVTGKRSIYDLYLNAFAVESEPQTGISSPASSEMPALKTGKGRIQITNPAQSAIRIYGVGGNLVYESSASFISLRLAHGIYIVNSNGQKRKVTL